MAWAQYTARRALLPGHVAGTVYVIEFQCTSIEPSRLVEADGKPSLSGKPNNTYWYGKDAWDVRTRSVPLDEADLLLEFLKSTEDRQIFTFDAYGKPERPHRPIDVYRTDKGHSSKRLVRMKQGGHNDRFVFGFAVQER